MFSFLNSASSSDLSRVNHFTPSVHSRRVNNVPRKETISRKETKESGIAALSQYSLSATPAIVVTSVH